MYHRNQSNHHAISIMKNTVIIFDFDGTLADTHKHIVDIFNGLSKQYNYKKIIWEKIDNYKDKTPRQIVKMLKVPLLKIPIIISTGRKQYHQKSSELKPFHGLREALNELKKLNIIMGIVSSNTKENIGKFLNQHDLNFFDFIHSTGRILSKNITLKNLIHNQGFTMDQVLYVGDEIRDIVAAKKLGIKVAAVGWGYNSAEILATYDPDYLLNDPKDLSSLIPT